MARRRRSSGYRRRSSSSYSSSRRRKSYGGSRRRTSAGQTLRLVLQNPGMQAPRPPFGSFIPSAMMMGMPISPNMGMDGGGVTLPGDMSPAQGGSGIPGARMVLRQPGRSPASVYVPPGYKLVREDSPDGADPT